MSFRIDTRLKRRSILPVILAGCLPAALHAQPSAPAQAAPPPAGCTQNCDKWVPVKSIDFSAKHDVLIRNLDGTLTPMDVPYFTSKQIAPGTWQILSDGDFSYLIEGDNEALVIDSTYGAGNIRAYEQTLTKKPIHYVANTHDHFDHTANDSYFDRAYMSEFTRTKATVPSASFSDITFPRGYPITVIGDGYVFHLGNRDIEVFSVPNHTMGDLVYLDRKERILFAGDMFSQDFMPINNESSVARFNGYLKKLSEHRKEFDVMAGGFKIDKATLLDSCLANTNYILAGHEGELPSAANNPPSPVDAYLANASKDPVPAPPGVTVYTRHIPHNTAGAGPARGGTPNPNLRRMVYGGCTITYDVRHIKD